MDEQKYKYKEIALAAFYVKAMDHGTAGHTGYTVLDEAAATSHDPRILEARAKGMIAADAYLNATIEKVIE